MSHFLSCPSSADWHHLLIGELTGVHGHKNLVLDTLQLVSVFRSQWEVVKDESSITARFLGRTQVLAEELAIAVGEREKPRQSPAGEIRHRALSLLVHTYDDVRRIVTYLRWKEGDYDRITPSLFAGLVPIPAPGVARGRCFWRRLASFSHGSTTVLEHVSPGNERRIEPRVRA